MRPLVLGTTFAACITTLLLAQSLSATAPSLVVELQGPQFKGDPSQLAWSPDGTTLCLQTLESGTSPPKFRHYLIRVRERDFHGADAAPDWARTYWEWKSARTPPGHPELVIEVDTQNQSGKIPVQSLRDKAANRPMENAVAAQAEAGSVVRTLTLKGEVIGRYVDQPLVPGMTFGWSPETLHAVAYAKPDGHLALMDLQGGKADVDAAKGILLPAWSPDGSRVVYVQKKGRREYALMQVEVSHR